MLPIINVRTIDKSETLLLRGISISLPDVYANKGFSKGILK